MQIIDRGVVFTAKPPSPHQSCQYGSVAVLPGGGRWLCLLRAGATKNESPKSALLTWSDDQGKTWSRAVEPWTPPKLDGRAGMLWGGAISRLADEELIAALYWVDYSQPDEKFFNDQTQGILDCQVFLSRSSDRGATWSKPQHVQTPFGVPVPPSGPVMRFSTGELMMQVEQNKLYSDASRPAFLISTLLFSTDGGKTWPRHTIAATDDNIFYGDQRVAILRDDRILDLFWTYDNKAAKYLPIQARESRDKGQTWSPIFSTGLEGQPATPVQLKDGRIVLVYVDRSGSPAIKARLSRDDARSFDPATELLIYNSALASQTRVKGSWQDALDELKTFSVGLPQTALLPDGDVLVTYYAGPHPDQTEIQWARVRI